MGDELTRLQAICDAATKGKWQWWDDYGKVNPDSGWHHKILSNAAGVVDNDVLTWYSYPEGGGGLDISDQDAQFIATARTAMPKLIACLQEVESRAGHPNGHILDVVKIIKQHLGSNNGEE